MSESLGELAALLLAIAITALVVNSIWGNHSSLRRARTTVNREAFLNKIFKFAVKCAVVAAVVYYAAWQLGVVDALKADAAL